MDIVLPVDVNTVGVGERTISKKQKSNQGQVVVNM